MFHKIVIFGFYLFLTFLLLWIRSLIFKSAKPKTNARLVVLQDKKVKRHLRLVKKSVNRQIKFVAAGMFLIYLMAHHAQAQQTIFNVPSGDVLDKGKVYSELDVTFKPNKDPNNVVQRFSSFVPRVVIGVGGRVEVGLNITGNIQPGDDATTLVPAIKYKLYDGGANGWAFIVGDNLFIPVRNKTYDLGNYVYGQLSKTLKTQTRLSAGVHHFSPDVVHPKSRAGGQFAIEQPITSKFGLAADWFTHKSATGYITAGVNFKPHPKITGYAAYSLGNENVRRGNHFFYMAIGINFN
ncbi:MAG: hypothetical protein AB1757_25835 [Acidobacteriota bacterium]